MAPHTLAAPMDCILNLCTLRGWPALTVLVVKAKTGRPASDAFDEKPEEIDKVRERVFRPQMVRTCATDRGGNEGGIRRDTVITPAIGMWLVPLQARKETGMMAPNTSGKGGG